MATGLLRSSADLLEKLERQYALLKPSETTENSELAAAYESVRDSIALLLNKEHKLENEQDLDALCEKIQRELRIIFAKKTADATIRSLNREGLKELRETVENARRYVRRQVEREMGWDHVDSEQASLQALTDAINRWHGLNLKPIERHEKTAEEKIEELPEVKRKALHAVATYVVNELGIDPALLAQVLCLIDAEHFSWNADTVDSISSLVGKHKVRVQSGFPEIPPEIFIAPEAGFFRKIVFNQIRDKFFTLYNQADGLPRVRRAIAEEVKQVTAKEAERLSQIATAEEKNDVRYEFALKRMFLASLSKYFDELENLPHPSRLKNSLSGDEPFPNRYQQVAMYETALLGRFFNAGEMGSGKTGAAIGTFEHLSEQKNEIGESLAKKALILCPANIVNIWRQRLSESDEGYFRKGTLRKDDVVIIDGPPEHRRELFKKARKARYVVIGIEMSRSETEAIAHEEWIQSIGADFLIIDEVHNVKNPHQNKEKKSDTDRIYRISQTEGIRYKVLLSGTPIPNHRKDIAAQLRLLHAEPPERENDRLHRLDPFETLLKSAPVSASDARIIAKYERKSVPHEHEAIEGLNWHNLAHLTKVVEDCDVPITQHYLLPFLYRPKAADSLPVHAKLNPVYEDAYNITPAERMAYNHVLRAEKLSDLGVQLDPGEEDSELGLLQKIHHLHRVCLHQGAVNGSTGTGESKFARLTHWIDQFIAEKDHSGKVVVTSPHYAQGVTRGKKETAEGEVEFETIHMKLIDKYGAENVYVMDGRAHTKKNLALFRKHKGPAVLLTQMKVVREGIDLSFVSRPIMLSPAWTRPEEEQYWRRFYRRGQEHDVQCIKLVANDTIESGINILSEQKAEIGERMLNGRHLTEDELQLLEVGKTGGRANPYLWWTALSKKEKLNVWWGNLMHKGERAVRDAMRRFGHLFVEFYNHDWETSYNGNTARLVSGIIDQLKTTHLPKLRDEEKFEIADIASGAFAVARTLAGKADIRVWSSDINPAMIGPEIGQEVLGGSYEKDCVDTAAMDDLPYRKSSKHIAVLSLALHYAMHRDNPPEAGKERMRTLLELNRILIDGGAAILTFPHSIFRGRQKQKFDEIAKALRYFGFELIPELSERALAKGKPDQKPFEVYVFTIRKIGEPDFDCTETWKNIPDAVRKGLDLSKEKKSQGGRKGGRRKRKRVIEQEEGEFHDEFILGSGKDIRFSMSPAQQALKRKVEEKKTLMAQSPEIVKTVLRKHQTFDDISAEKWLEIPLDAIVQCPGGIQDAYAQAVIARSRGTVTEEFLENLNRGHNIGSLNLQNAEGKQYLVLSSMNNVTPAIQKKYLMQNYGEEKE